METAASSIRRETENTENKSITEKLQWELDRQPANIDIRCDLGMALLREERFDEAVDCYKEALRIEPEHPDAHIGLGHVLIAMGSMLKLGRRFSDSEARTGETTQQSRRNEDKTAVQQRTPLAEFCKSNTDQQPIVPLKPKQTDEKYTAPASTGSALRFSVDEVLNHMVYSVESADIQKSPFTYINFENLFPREFYTKILNHLPEDSCYQELRHKDAMLPNGKSARLKFELFKENLHKLPDRLRPFWEKYMALFNSERLARAVFTKMNFQANVTPVLLLLRDLPGYKILPHPDIPEKAATVMMYLPRDNSQLHLGTCLYVKNGEDDFSIAKRLAFRPNSGFTFVVTDESWHGVEQTTERDGIRDSLGIVYFHSHKMRPGL